MASLRAFEAAARHLSFKQAAIELGVTATAVSHQIRLLEQFCGEPLFRRRPRPLTLSSAGEQLFPVLRNGFDAFVSVLGSVADAGAKGPLRVTSPNAFAGHWLVPRLPQWRAAHPETPLEIIGVDHVLNLRSGEADVAIRYAKQMPSDLVAQEIFRDSFFPVCSPAVLASDPVKRTADLLRHPLIHFNWVNGDPDAPTWSKWLATARAVDPDLPQVGRPWDLSFREETHAIDAVIAGQGIAICSDIVVGRELEAGTLVRAHEMALPGYGFYLVHMPRHPRDGTIKAFLNWMRSPT